jgi:hypothetical protein
MAISVRLLSRNTFSTPLCISLDIVERFKTVAALAGTDIRCIRHGMAPQTSIAFYITSFRSVYPCIVVVNRISVD